MSVDNEKSNIRHMVNSFRGWPFYSSVFNPLTGLIVREVEEVDPHDSRGYGLASVYSKTQDRKEWDAIRDEWNLKYGTTLKYDDREFHRVSYLRSDRAFSPVPETIDIKVSDWCSHGCKYCYMDSTKKGEHAPKDLLVKIFEGLDYPPYQIAFGGGEPTAHPDFPWFLKYTREQGTVPNYTTAGFIFREDVIDATNKYCGGVALTYHAFKGPDYFKEIHDKWRKALAPRVQLNVHVLFDDDVAKSICDLIRVGLRDLNIVLLAYYPEVGRSSVQGSPSKKTYAEEFPAVLNDMTKARYRIAFSEGLLPYFLSHEFPEVDVRFASQQEGLFSCYVDDHGRVSHSSFSPPTEEDPSIYTTRFQELWEKLPSTPYYRTAPSVCGECKHELQCNVPHPIHFMSCAYAKHNSGPLGKLRLPLA